MEFSRTDGRVSVTAKNRSVYFTGSGPDEIGAMKALNRSLQEQLGPIFDFSADSNTRSVKIRKKIP